jgi:hypothetical protein
MCVAVGAGLAAVAAADGAETMTARRIQYHNYDQAIALELGDMKAVLCPQAGGRVLEFSVGGKQALWLDDKEKEWQPGAKSPMSAGRFDFGPELNVAPHPAIWSGEWTTETLDESANPLVAALVLSKMTSPRDEATGVQLTRLFHLHGDQADVYGRDARSRGLSCLQMIKNLGDKPIDVCHWGRSFSPGGGICFIPLGDRPSRFPNKYVIYEDSAIINVRNTDEKIRERDGFLEILGPPRKPKLGFDTYAGWLAYLMPNDVLFVKHFHADPKRLYNEAAGLTLSVWYPDGPRIELEPIGPGERLLPGESASFTEDWIIYDFPYPRPGEMVDLKQLRKVAEPYSWKKPKE